MPGKPCAYGETPLGFAVSTGQQEIAELLVEHGADMEAVDSLGNNLLHLAVEHSFPHMYKWVVDRFKQEESLQEIPGECPLTRQVNNAEMSPLALAAAQGNKEMFEFLLDQDKLEQWSYGPITACLYPLDLFDNHSFDSMDPRGALEFIVEHEQTELLMIPRVLLLLKRKWQSYAPLFRQRLYKVLFTLFFFTLAIISQPISPSDGDHSGGVNETQANATRFSPLFSHPYQYSHYTIAEDFTSFRWWTCTISELAIVLSAILKAIPEVRELAGSGLRAYFGGSGAQLMENVISSGYCVTVFIAIPLRIFQSYYYDLSLAVAVYLCWSYMLMFLLGHPSTGHFVIMIVKMLLGDLLKFMLIFTVFLMGFTYAFYVLFDEEGILALIERAMSLFGVMVNGYDPDFIPVDRYDVISTCFLFVYVLLSTILLLNLLIAMMSETYSNVSEEALNQWHLEVCLSFFPSQCFFFSSPTHPLFFLCFVVQWARIIFSIEAELTDEQFETLKYWTVIDGKRYLMTQETNPDHFKKPSEQSARQLKIAKLKQELEETRTQLAALIKHLPPHDAGISFFAVPGSSSQDS